MSRLVRIVLALGFTGSCVLGSPAVTETFAYASRAVEPVAPAAVLDPSFDGGGLVAVGESPGERGALAAVAPNNELIVSGGSAVKRLTGDGQLLPDPDLEAALVPTSKGRFFLSDFTVDSAGRLLVIGTVNYPRTKRSKAPQSISPSAVKIVRFLSDGGLDQSFGKGGSLETDFGLRPPKGGHGRSLQRAPSMEASGITVGPSGQIVVTGRFATRLGPSCAHDVFMPVPIFDSFVVRLNEGGALDQSFARGGVFGGRGEDPLRAAAISPPVVSSNGDITYSTTEIYPCPPRRSERGLVQLGASGEIHRSVGDDGVLRGYFTDMASRSDGSVLALSTVPIRGDQPVRARLTSLGPSGEIDHSFGRGGHRTITLGKNPMSALDSLALDAEGRILLGGLLATKTGPAALMLRLSGDGQADPGFGPGGRVVTKLPGLTSFGPSDLLVDAQNRVVTLHQYSSGDVSGILVARYLLSG